MPKKKAFQRRGHQIPGYIPGQFPWYLSKSSRTHVLNYKDSDGNRQSHKCHIDEMPDDVREFVYSIDIQKSILLGSQVRLTRDAIARYRIPKTKARGSAMVTVIKSDGQIELSEPLANNLHIDYRHLERVPETDVARTSLPLGAGPEDTQKRPRKVKLTPGKDRKPKNNA